MEMNMQLLHAKAVQLVVVIYVCYSPQHLIPWIIHALQALPEIVAHGKAQKTLGKQHTISIVPANVSLPSVFYRALDKYFAES